MEREEIERFEMRQCFENVAEILSYSSYELRNTVSSILLEEKQPERR